MRLLVEFIVCGTLVMMAGCQPKDGKIQEESQVDQAQPVRDSNAAITTTAQVGRGSMEKTADLISADKWKKASAKQRVEIATQLISKKQLIGLSEDAVEKALGYPSMRFERMVYNFYVDVSAPTGVTPGLMILIGRSGHVERVGTTGFPKSQNATILPFDKQKWQDGNDYIRFGMAASVWRGKLLDGKNRSQVVELLGEPSKTIPPLLIYKCGKPTAQASGEDQPREKTLSLRFEKGHVVQAKLE